MAQTKQNSSLEETVESGQTPANDTKNPAAQVEETWRTYVGKNLTKLKERKTLLVNFLNTTTNPLEKLSCKDRLEELANVFTLFSEVFNAD